MSTAGPPVLRAISPDATAEEIAAIVAAIAMSTAQTSAPADVSRAATHDWVHASRLTARRAAFNRGSWRLSGRIPRRPRP